MFSRVKATAFDMDAPLDARRAIIRRDGDGVEMVELAWDEGIEKMLLNTCTLDHKKALATYQRAGFVP